ncbi:MAG: c-type cytochrome [Planctomycetota bacterium]
MSLLIASCGGPPQEVIDSWQAITNGVVGAAMPAHRDLRGAQELDDLILYLRTLQDT